MIPASAITFDGDTALVVFDPMQTCDPGMEPWPDFNRPCDTCNEGRVPHAPGLDPEIWRTAECIDCDGTGRHTFDVDVECEYHDGPTSCDECHHWVHVIDVLPIEADSPDPFYPRVVMRDDGKQVLIMPARKRLTIGSQFPPDAARLLAEGKKPRLVRLAVHS